ncbi:MAG: hypothetical protein ACYS47_20615, partial [Planctomycetota bacterium]
MTRRRTAWLWPTLLALPFLLSLGCPSDDDDPLPPPDPVDVLLQNGGGTGGGVHSGTVTVVVFDEQDDTRVQDAEVLLDDGSGYVQQTTDATGTTVFTGVAAGTFDLTIAKTGFVNLSIFGVEASLLVMPLASARVQVDGTISGGSASGTVFAITFQALESRLFDTPKPLYGEIVKQPTGADPTYTVMFDKGQTDTLTFTEADGTTGEIVNRKTLVVGPYTTDQAGVNVIFTGTTGLHEITGTISDVNTATQTVGAYFKDGNIWYSSFNVSGAGASRTYSMKLPPNRTCRIRVLADVGLTIDPAAPTTEGREFDVTTGAADNATVPTVDLDLDMVTRTGSFSNYGASTGVAMFLRYGNLATVTGAPAAVGYQLRLPRNRGAQIAVVGVTAALVMERGIEQAFGPFSGSGVQDFDLVAGSPL